MINPENELIEQKIIQSGIVPVFYHDDPEVCVQVMAASYRAGLRVFEFTNRGENAYHNFRLLHESVVRDYPDMMLGAGTLFTRSEALHFIDAGAAFSVSPALVPEMNEVNKRAPWIPGCATISEIHTARSMGATLIKVFPGDLLGPAFIQSALSVMPGLKLMPTGGVEPTRENLKAWFSSGVACVGMGSKLIPKEMIANRQWDALTERIRNTLSLVKEIR